MPKRNLAWWFWVATDIALVGYLLFDRDFLAAVLVLSAVQIPLFAILQGWKSFPAQLRIAYLCLLVAGLWQPLAVIHWIQLVGTTAMVLFGYCFLARCLSLLPWNRSVPITADYLAYTFLTLPVEGSILAAQDEKLRQG